MRRFNPFCPHCGTFRNLQNTSVVKKYAKSGESYDCLYYICKSCQTKKILKQRNKKKSVAELTEMYNWHLHMSELYRKELLHRGVGCEN
jgi:phage terminase large subunit GpA-like protein